MHILYFILYHQCVVFWKINTRFYCVLKHTEKAILKLHILPPRNEVMEHKSFEVRFQVLYELTGMCVMVLNFRSFLIPTIFNLPNNFVPYVLLMDDLIYLQFIWADL
jgi:hypothetical protein